MSLRVEVGAEAVRFRVRVTPRASRTAIAGLHGDALRIRVAAPPVDGKANAELVRFLARTLGVARAAVALVRGETGRTKTVEVAGDAARIAARLEALAGRG